MHRPECAATCIRASPIPSKRVTLGVTYTRSRPGPEPSAVGPESPRGARTERQRVPPPCFADRLAHADPRRRRFTTVLRNLASTRWCRIQAWASPACIDLGQNRDEISPSGGGMPEERAQLICLNQGGRQTAAGKHRLVRAFARPDKIGMRF